MATNQQVAHAWAHRQAARATNMHTDGTTLWSYRTAVAVWHEGTPFISSDSMTQTTGKQLSYVRRTVSGDCFLTPAFQYGRDCAPSAAECITAAADEHREAFKTLLRKRVGLDYAIDRYRARSMEILSIAAKFGVELAPFPDPGEDLQEKARAIRAQERERQERVRHEQEERDKRHRQDAADQFAEWLTSGQGSCPTSYRNRHEQTDYITVRDGKVITSRGADAPLDHVVKAIRFYDSRLNPDGSFTPYHTNGHKIHLGIFTLDAIDAQGNVIAGCHRFTTQEIDRFRRQWGL